MTPNPPPFKDTLLPPQTVTSPPTMSCQHPTLLGGVCKRQGKHVYDQRHVCRQHMECMKAKEECAICYDHMTSTKQRIRLSPCGHYFHLACLQKADSALCPLCRTPISVSQAMDVLPDLMIEPVLSQALQVKKKVARDALFEGFDVATSMASIHPDMAHYSTILLKSMRQLMEARVSPEQMVQWLHTTQMTANFMRHQGGSMEGMCLVGTQAGGVLNVLPPAL